MKKLLLALSLNLLVPLLLLSGCGKVETEESESSSSSSSEISYSAIDRELVDALEESNKERVKAAFRNGANPNILFSIYQSNDPSWKSQTPILAHYIQHSISAAVVQAFVDAKVDLSVTFADYYQGTLTLLGRSIANTDSGYSLKVMKILLAAGANPNQVYGNIAHTALHDAVNRARGLSHVKLLLQYGADPDAVNATGLKPGDGIDLNRGENRQILRALELKRLKNKRKH